MGRRRRMARRLAQQIKWLKCSERVPTQLRPHRTCASSRSSSPGRHPSRAPRRRSVHRYDCDVRSTSPLWAVATIGAPHQRAVERTSTNTAGDRARGERPHQCRGLLVGIRIVGDAAQRHEDDFGIEQHGPTLDVLAIVLNASVNFSMERISPRSPWTCAQPVIPGLTRWREA